MATASVGRNAWQELCAHTTVRTLEAKQAPRPVVCINADATVRMCMETLAENNILSAPVVRGREILGFVDVIDLMGAGVRAFCAGSPGEETRCKAPQQRIPVDEALFRSAKFFQTKVVDLINLSGLDFPVTVRNEDSLVTAIRLLSNVGKPFFLHRAVVLNDDEEVAGILSQTDIVEWLREHLDQLERAIPELVTADIYKLGLVHACITLHVDAPLLNVFSVLFDNRVSGVALVDREGRLVANISATDFRGIIPSLFPVLQESALLFLTKGLQSLPRAPVTAQPHATLREAVTSISIAHVHRIYVVDRAARFLGVISLSDILALLCDLAEKGTPAAKTAD